MSIAINSRRLEDSIRQAVSDYMGSLALDVPQPFWIIFFSPDGAKLSGLVDSRDHDEPAQVAEQWASLLGLDHDETVHGVRTLHGSPVDFLKRVEIWYTADRAESESWYRQIETSRNQLHAEAEAPNGTA